MPPERAVNTHTLGVRHPQVQGQALRCEYDPAADGLSITVIDAPAKVSHTRDDGLRADLTADGRIKALHIPNASTTDWSDVRKLLGYE